MPSTSHAHKYLLPYQSARSPCGVHWQVPCELWLQDEMGKPANLWDMFKERPEREDQFSKAMTAIDQLVRICSFSFFEITHQGCTV